MDLFQISVAVIVGVFAAAFLLLAAKKPPPL